MHCGMGREGRARVLLMGSGFPNTTTAIPPTHMFFPQRDFANFPIECWGLYTLPLNLNRILWLLWLIRVWWRWHGVASKARALLPLSLGTLALREASFRVSGLAALRPPLCEEAQSNPHRETTWRAPESTQRKRCLTLHPELLQSCTVLIQSLFDCNRKPKLPTQIPNPQKLWKILMVKTIAVVLSH